MTTITLSADESLVLFELVCREIDINKTKRLPGVIDHPAEFWALDGVYGQLQKDLVEPFRSDYAELLAAARERVADARDPDRTYVLGGDA